MGKISYLLEQDLDKYMGLQGVETLDTVSDVATLIEVYRHTIKEVDFRKIKYVVKDSENYYYMVISNIEEDFDLFSFIGNCFVEDINVSSINARHLFPSRLSRGIYEPESPLVVEEEDIATSFLDESELDMLEKTYELYHIKLGVTLTIGNKGLIIGRSPNKVDYLIKGNTSIGRIHCNLYVDSVDNTLKVHDFDSLNGTFVNGLKVHSSNDAVLSNGDILTLANEEFRVI